MRITHENREGEPQTVEIREINLDFDNVLEIVFKFSIASFLIWTLPGFIIGVALVTWAV